MSWANQSIRWSVGPSFERLKRAYHRTKAVSALASSTQVVTVDSRELPSNHSTVRRLSRTIDCGQPRASLAGIFPQHPDSMTARRSGRKRQPIALVPASAATIGLSSP